MEILENIILAIQHTSGWEWAAVFSGVLYVILISFKNIAAWLFAIISSLLYVYLCFNSKLYIETGLQFFYLAMGIYGWYKWKKVEEGTEQKIIRWSTRSHLLNLCFSGILMLVIGYVFDHFTDQANPYTDAFTTIFSLAATFMVTQKVLENWIYWIIIDAASVYLFASRGLYLTSVLFIFFTGIAVFGFFQWRKLYLKQSA